MRVLRRPSRVQYTAPPAGGSWESQLAGIGGGAWSLYRDGTMESTVAGAPSAGGFGYYYSGRTVVDAGAPHGGGYMETFYANGELNNGDGGSVIESTAISAKEMYVCFNILFSSNYRWHNNGEKLWFAPVPGGTYNVFNVHYLTSTTGATCEIYGRRTTGGTFDAALNAAVVAITKGTWATVQMYFKMNTGTANEDGLCKIWVDDTVVLNRTDWQFNSVNAAAANFEGFRFDGTRGGGLDSGGALPAEQTRRVNRLTCRYR